MVIAASNRVCDTDLAGVVEPTPTLTHLHRRIRHLIDHYLSVDHLSDRLADLPHQFEHPQPRPWNPIDWPSLSANQLVGIDLSVFQTVLVGALNTEAPIRGYTQTSRRYLEQLHGPMAQFVGGTVDATGQLTELGLWEKEERQHTPALLKIYTQLTGETVKPSLRTVRGYCPTQNPRADLYRHGLHRIATEYGATCLYLWMMAYTTGPLQAVLAELLQDEINHMTKFWGFGMWAYPEANGWWVAALLLQTSRCSTDPRNSLWRTLRRMRGTLQWSDWTITQRLTFALTCIAVLRRMTHWAAQLSSDQLRSLFD